MSYLALKNSVQKEKSGKITFQFSFQINHQATRYTQLKNLNYLKILIIDIKIFLYASIIYFKTKKIVLNEGEEA